MRVSELTGHALNWAVARCEGATEEWRSGAPFLWDGVPCIRIDGHDANYRPSTDWSQGGSIIERERIAVTCTPDAWCAYAHDGLQDVVMHGVHAGKAYNWKHKQNAETPLVAAMRCYVTSKLGDEVEIPAELLTQGETA